jgi:hypothetical protein
MYPQSMMGGEGASTPALGRVAMAMPALVVWPMLTPQSVTLEASHEIYRLAYEWAQALMRPRAYEIASRVMSN